MKLRTVGVLTCVAAVYAVSTLGCKSKETTSAMIHNETGRYDLAIKTANEAIAKDPNDAEAYFQLGLAYAHIDSVGLAYDAFMKSEKLDPPRAQIIDDNIQSNFAKHYNIALTFIKGKPLFEELEQGAMEFEKASEADPRQARGYYQLGKTYALMGETEEKYYEKAIPALDKVLELATPSDIHYIEALSLAGQVLAKTGRPDEAVSRFNRLVEEDPTNYKVIEDIGMDRLEAKDWKGSTVFLELAVKARSKIGAEDFNLYYNLGVAYFQLGKQLNDTATMMMSVDYYQKGLLLQPDEPTTVYNILVAFVVAEDWRQAGIWGERYVALQAEDEKGWRLLARSYTELGDAEKARRCMDRYEQLRQANSN